MDPKQLEFESILEAYPVRLINFEGPLDLLLHLIKKNEMNVYDIRISTVTQQHARLDVNQRGRHHEKLADHVEVHLLHQIEILEILLRDGRDTNVLSLIHI